MNFFSADLSKISIADVEGATRRRYVYTRQHEVLGSPRTIRAMLNQSGGTVMKDLILCILCLAIPAFCQDILQPGPSGRPILVSDGAGHWSKPISVYSDRDVELFVPDITTPGWIQWNAREFRQAGTFGVYVYSLYKNDQACQRDRILVGHKADPKLLEACRLLRYQRKLVSIDTRRKTVRVFDVLLMERDALYNPMRDTVFNQTVPLGKVSPEQRRAYNRMSEIVTREMGRYKGATVEDVIRHDGIVQSGNIMSAICGATNEQVQNYIDAALRGDPNADQLYKAACKGH